jgi:nucleoside-diphosphate-sugar epimerase
MKILITGGAGYIGSVLTNLALQKGFQVKAADILWFNKSIPLIHYSNPNYEFVHCDLCDHSVHEQLLSDVDFVIHCAAVVGDPASKLFPELTQKLNYDAAVALFEKAKVLKKKGFIFFSTCSNYGVSDGMATEKSELKPLSLYAETKVGTERHIIEHHDHLDYIVCRLSTVYGLSPRMRFDLTVNDFTMNAYRSKKLDIFLPESYRPYIHVFDLARTVLALIERWSEARNQVFNLGFKGENYQKIQIAKAVEQYIPELKINILKEGGDLRDYQVDFSKVVNFLGLQNFFNAEKGVKELTEILKAGIIKDFDDPVYYNTSPNFN